MAEAGFYWCGNMDKDRDTVCCFLCGKLLDGWESTDDPWSEHRQHAPQCHFVKLGRPEKDLTIGELLDLMEKFLEKFRYSLLEKAKSKVAEKIREMRGNCRAIWSENVRLSQHKICDKT